MIFYLFFSFRIRGLGGELDLEVCGGTIWVAADLFFYVKINCSICFRKTNIKNNYFFIHVKFVPKAIYINVVDAGSTILLI